MNHTTHTRNLLVTGEPSSGKPLGHFHIPDQAEPTTGFVRTPAVEWLESEAAALYYYNRSRLGTIRPMFEVLADDPEPEPDDSCYCGDPACCPVVARYPDPFDTDRWVWL